MSPAPASVARFAVAASRFCKIVESLDEASDRAAFIHDLRCALTEVLEAGNELPDTEPSEDADAERPTHQEWMTTFTKLQSVIGMLPGGLEDYVTVPDDLADIWRDLRPGLDALTSGARWEDVTWDWKLGLNTHFGKHAENALSALRDA